MNLSSKLLAERYHLWKARLADTGFWKAEELQPVTISLRPASKCYNGMFKRKTETDWRGRRTHIDRIFIYNNPRMAELKTLDSVIVHEMIHQYIIQNSIPDRGHHGPTFKGLMRRINAAFPEELEIVVAHRNTQQEMQPSGPGSKMHALLVIEHDTHFFCCKIDNAYVGRMQSSLRRLSFRLPVRRMRWFASTDRYFDSMRCCRTALHGLRLTIGQLPAFISGYNLIEIKDTTNEI